MTSYSNMKRALKALNDIKQAIINKGVPVPDGTPVEEFALKIGLISGGMLSTDWIEAKPEQDNIGWYKSAGGSVTVPSVSWEIKGNCGTCEGNIYYLRDGLNKVGTDIFGECRIIETYRFAEKIIPCVSFENGNRLKPVIKVPKGFSLGENTYIDIVSDIRNNAVCFAYRLYNK